MLKQIRLYAWKLAGKQEQAEELVDFYQKPDDYINERSAMADNESFTGGGDDCFPCSLELPMTAGTT